MICELIGCVSANKTASYTKSDLKRWHYLRFTDIKFVYCFDRERAHVRVWLDLPFFTPPDLHYHKLLALQQAPGFGGRFRICITQHQHLLMSSNTVTSIYPTTFAKKEYDTHHHRV